MKSKPAGKGKWCVYPGKVRQPRSYLMTPGGHEITDQHVRRTGMSRNDLLETLVRLHGHRVEPVKRP